MKNNAHLALHRNNSIQNTQSDIVSGWLEKIKNSDLNAGIFITSPMLFIVVFLAYPLFNMLVKSIAGGNLTAEYYLDFFSNGLYLQAILLTMKTSALVTLICLLLAYPLAYIMTLVSRNARGIILAAAMVPSCAGLLAQPYVRMAMFQGEEILNWLLLRSELISEPLRVTYSTLGGILTMTQVMLPYMVLCLYPVLSGIDKNLLSAAENLGARPYQSFFKVLLPLSFQGIASGSKLVFIMGICFSVTPYLQGSQKDSMLYQLIQSPLGDLSNQGFASAITFTLMAVVLMFLLFIKSLLVMDNQSKTLT